MSDEEAVCGGDGFEHYPEQLRPTMDHIVVRLHQRYRDNKTTGGILLPSDPDDPRRRAVGTVKAVGPLVGYHIAESTGAPLELPGGRIRVGDTVLVNSFTGQDLDVPFDAKHEAGLWKIFCSHEVLGVYEGQAIPIVEHTVGEEEEEPSHTV